MGKPASTLLRAAVLLLIRTAPAYADSAETGQAPSNDPAKPICLEAAYEDADMVEITIGYSAHISIAPQFRDHPLEFDDVRSVFWKLRIPRDYVVDRRHDMNADALDRQGVDVAVGLAVLYPQMVPYYPVWRQIKGVPDAERPCRISARLDEVPLQQVMISLGPPIAGRETPVPKTYDCKDGPGVFFERRPDLDFDGFAACRHWGLFTHTDYYRGRVGDSPVFLSCSGDTLNCSLVFARDGLPIGAAFKQLGEWRAVLERTQEFLSQTLVKQ